VALCEKLKRELQRKLLVELASHRIKDRIREESIAKDISVDSAVRYGRR
jgi:hypothetical protein